MSFRIYLPEKGCGPEAFGGVEGGQDSLCRNKCVSSWNGSKHLGLRRMTPIPSNNVHVSRLPFCIHLTVKGDGPEAPKRTDGGEDETRILAIDTEDTIGNRSTYLSNTLQHSAQVSPVSVTNASVYEGGYSWRVWMMYRSLYRHQSVRNRNEKPHQVSRRTLRESRRIRMHTTQPDELPQVLPMGVAFGIPRGGT